MHNLLFDIIIVALWWTQPEQYSIVYVYPY